MDEKMIKERVKLWSNKRWKNGLKSGSKNGEKLTNNRRKSGKIVFEKMDENVVEKVVEIIGKN